MVKVKEFLGLYLGDDDIKMITVEPDQDDMLTIYNKWDIVKIGKYGELEVSSFWLNGNILRIYTKGRLEK